MPTGQHGGSEEEHRGDNRRHECDQQPQWGAQADPYRHGGGDQQEDHSPLRCRGGNGGQHRQGWEGHEGDAEETDQPVAEVQWCAGEDTHGIDNDVGQVEQAEYQQGGHRTPTLITGEGCQEGPVIDRDHHDHHHQRHDGIGDQEPDRLDGRIHQPGGTAVAA